MAQSHSISHYVSDHFPDLDHPLYQTAVERAGFIAITTALLSLLIGSIALVVITLA